MQTQLNKFAIRKSFLKSICRLDECVGLEYPLYYWDKVYHSYIKMVTLLQNDALRRLRKIF